MSFFETLYTHNILTEMLTSSEHAIGAEVASFRKYSQLNKRKLELLNDFLKDWDIGNLRKLKAELDEFRHFLSKEEGIEKDTRKAEEKAKAKVEEAITKERDPAIKVAMLELRKELIDLSVMLEKLRPLLARQRKFFEKNEENLWKEHNNLHELLSAVNEEAEMFKQKGMVAYREEELLSRLKAGMEKVKQEAMKTPVIHRQTLNADMHFHMDFPKSEARALKRAVRIWEVILKEKLDVLICTEHQYREPMRAYRIMLNGRTELILELQERIEKLKRWTNNSNRQGIEASIKDIRDTIFRLQSIYLFCGVEVLTVDYHEAIVFTKDPGYDPKMLADELESYERNLILHGLEPDKRYRKACEAFIAQIDQKCITDLALEPRLLKPHTLTLFEVIDICKQRGFGVYLPHLFFKKNFGNIYVLGKMKIDMLIRAKSAPADVLVVLGQNKAGNQGRSSFEALEALGRTRFEEIVQTGRYTKDEMYLVGGEELIRVVRNRNIGVSGADLSMYVPMAMAGKLSKLPLIGGFFSSVQGSLRKQIFAPREFTERANPAFYAGGSDAHAIEMITNAIKVVVNQKDSRDAVYDAIINNKDPQISTSETIANLEIPSEYVKGTLKGLWRAGFEDYLLKEPKVLFKHKLQRINKINELIEKAADPSVGADELTRIRGEIEKPDIFKQMSRRQLRQYKKAMKKRFGYLPRL